MTRQVTVPSRRTAGSPAGPSREICAAWAIARASPLLGRACGQRAIEAMLVERAVAERRR